MTTQEKWVRLDLGVPFDVTIPQQRIDEVGDWVKKYAGQPAGVAADGAPWWAHYDGCVK